MRWTRPRPLDRGSCRGVWGGAAGGGVLDPPTPPADRAIALTPSQVALSGAGVGVSLADGMVRFDLSRGIAPSRDVRFDMYLEARF